MSLRADFGVLPASVQTDTSGKATAAYTAGQVPADATTRIAEITATVGENEDATNVYNFTGFTGMDFHQSQVTDARFIAYTEWGVGEVQAFFEDRNSFFRRFYLVGNQGDRGFYDTDGNGNYTAGEPRYCADGGVACPMNGPRTSAAAAFVNAATSQGQRVNPKLLLVQTQKERSLISSATLPSAFDLNRAFGCDPVDFPNFLMQLSDCAARRLRRWFDGPGIPAMPFFFPMGPTEGTSINHFVHDAQTGVSERRRVGFTINTRATHSLYKYTNYVVAVRENGILGGGNYSFELLWRQYQF